MKNITPLILDTPGKVLLLIKFRIAPGQEFVASELDKLAQDLLDPLNKANAIRDALRMGYIRHAGYGPAQRDSAPNAPANVWVRTSRRSNR